MNPSEVCNFDCLYCRQHTQDRVKGHPFEIERFMQRLEQSGRTFLVTVSGGEPFMIPNFIEFAEALTKKHYLRLDTNLSLTEKCRQFSQAIDPERVVEVVFSTHILEREKRKIDIMELVGLVKEFQAKGFKMVGNYVAHPLLLGRLEKDVEFFGSHGIKVLPNLFRGSYRGKIYSRGWVKTAYSRKELELIARLNPLALLPLQSPHGKPCQAGCAAFYMDENYEISPCLMLRRIIKIGKFFGEWGLFSKVIRCPRIVCTDQYNRTLCASLSGLEEGLAYGQKNAVSACGVASELQTAVMLVATLPRSVKSIVKRIGVKLKRLCTQRHRRGLSEKL